jgi:hypothetical protein
MADRIEALALGEQQRGIELRVQDRLLAVGRAGEVRAVGREDRAAAAPEQGIAVQL